MLFQSPLQLLMKSHSTKTWTLPVLGSSLPAEEAYPIFGAFTTTKDFLTLSQIFFSDSFVSYHLFCTHQGPEAMCYVMLINANLLSHLILQTTLWYKNYFESHCRNPDEKWYWTEWSKDCGGGDKEDEDGPEIKRCSISVTWWLNGGWRQERKWSLGWTPEIR